jgi:hypothetical protein
MTDIKMDYDFISALDKLDSLKAKKQQPTNNQKLNPHLSNSIISNLKKSQSTYIANMNKQKKDDQLFNTFTSSLDKFCNNTNCMIKVSAPIFCSNCILNAYSLNFEKIDENIFYFLKIHNGFQANIYLTKDDISTLSNLFTRPITPSVTYTSKKPLATAEELLALLTIHQKFIFYNHLSKSSYFSNIQPIFSLMISKYHLLKKFYNIYNSENEFIKKHNSSVPIEADPDILIDFLLKKFDIPRDPFWPGIEKIYSSILKTTNSQINTLPSTNLFTKLVQTLYILSSGNPLTIKKLAIMFAKIFIGRKLLTDLCNKNNFTIILTNEVSILKDFLMDILTYAPSSKAPQGSTSYQNKKTPTSPSFAFPRKNDGSFYHVTEYSATYLCNETNLENLFKAKVLGNILNIDTSNTTITNPGVFSKLIKGIALTKPYNGLLKNKLTYRSNCHYIKICSSLDNTGIKQDDNISFNTINCINILSNFKYIPLEAHELFFLTTGFLDYGVDCLLQIDQCKCPIDDPSTIHDEMHPIDDSTVILQFIENFYKDTFSLHKANIIQKEDLNDFVAADNDLYENYANWFRITYKQDIVCNNSVFKNILKKHYGVRPDTKELKALSAEEQQHALSNRYYKNNEVQQRGVSGLKLNKSHLDAFFENTKKSSTDATTQKQLFAKYMNNLFENYSPYSM